MFPDWYACLIIPSIPSMLPMSIAWPTPSCPNGCGVPTPSIGWPTGRVFRLGLADDLVGFGLAESRSRARAGARRS